ncbi:hypothetical protein LXA43DRAFT_1063534 [Ganoderma leucocontextum]|nr:hypothetical protein LXA43DRAFT_1063534 [Ganoderma leucocontextum]
MAPTLTMKPPTPRHNTTTKPPIPCLNNFKGDYFGQYEPADFDNYDEFTAEEPEGDLGLGEPAGDAMEVDPKDGGSKGAGVDGVVEVEESDDEEYEVEEDAFNLEEERGWEPPPPPPENPRASPTAPNANEEPLDGPNTQDAQCNAADHLHTKTYVSHFPGVHAGAPISQQCEDPFYDGYKQSRANSKNPYHPFISRIDWLVARWAKMRGPGSTAVMELLQIEQLAELLGLSFQNSRKLNKKVDEELASGRPRFIRRKIIVGGEAFEVFYWDIIQCIRALYGDPEFNDRTVRVYFNMHTGKWWWEMQAAIEKRKPGATIIPIIISSDKTQLTVFGNWTAYPASRRRALANLFHKCMVTIVKPLIQAGVHGIKVISGDGVARRGHPVFAMYIGDYPEQLLVTCCKTGTCPKCNIPRDEVGATTEAGRPLRDLKKVQDALAEVDNSVTALRKPARKLASNLSAICFGKIFRLVKHLLVWLRQAYGSEELDIRIFFKGITTLQWVTGKEHADICRFLLALIIGLPTWSGMSTARLYPSHTSETLSLLHGALERFHANKAVFVDLGIRMNFMIPKLHSFDHYGDSIKLFGTTDNYDTQYTEHLHIDSAKDVYRAHQKKRKISIVIQPG